MNQATKKVLYVITKATIGGAQKYVYDLATHLPAGYEPVVAYGVKGTLADDLSKAGIKTTPLPSLGRDIDVFADIKSYFALRRCMHEEQPSVVHLNSSKAAALGAMAARIAGVPHIVFTAHGWPFKEARNPLWRAFAYIASWFTALLSHAVICVSEDDLHRAQRMPLIGRKAHLIHNGIDLGMQFGSGETIREAFPADAKIVGTIGELTANKNQIALIERAKADPAICVAIVGEGEDRPMLEKKIREYGLQERVKLFGFVPAQEVFKGFDVFALPSKKEGLPYVLLEAQLAGLPIEANRIGGVPDILDNDIGEFSLQKMLAHTVALYR